MATHQQVNEQCAQYLKGLTGCVKSTLVEPAYDLNDQERTLQLAYSDQRADLIRDTLSTLLSDMKAHRNRHVPIFRLVDEILIEIWSFSSMEDRLSISQVCRKWRHSSLSASKLWTELYIDKEPTRKLFLFLKRAGNSPLHITHMSNSNAHMPMQSIFSPNPNLFYNSLGSCGHGCSHAMFNPIPHAVAPIRPPRNPMHTIFPINHFNEIIRRSRFLHATVKDEDAAYVNYKTLDKPMPHLRCLIFSYSTNPGFGTIGNIALNLWRRSKRWFEGVTPQLRELYLSNIHAPWDDRIYSNLTHLQLCNPITKATPQQLLRILSLCPGMEYLDISNCFSQPFQGVPTLIVNGDGGNNSESTTVVTLERLWYLHFDESEAEPFSRFLSRMICPALETLIICAPTLDALVSFTDAMTLADTDPTQNAFTSFFSRTTRLTLSMCSSSQLTVIGRFSEARNSKGERWIRRGHSIEKSPGPGWSISCNFFPTAVNMLDINAALFPIPPPNPADRRDPRDILDQAESIGVQFNHIESIEITGHVELGEAFHKDLFSRCLSLKSLKIHAIYAPLQTRSRRNARHPRREESSTLTPSVAIRILQKVIKDSMCPELETLEMRGNFVDHTRELTQWLRSRARKQRRLKRVVVDVSGYWGKDHQWDIGARVKSQLEDTLEPRDSNDTSEETGLVWKNTYEYGILGLPLPLLSGNTASSDPDEQEYQEWLGSSNLPPDTISFPYHLPSMF